MKTRLLEPEDMDDPALDPAAHRLALKGLARLNRISFSAEAIGQVLEREYRALLSRSSTPPAWTILDLATGGGDLPLHLAIRARSRGYDWRCQGADISPVALEHAAEKARVAGVAVDWLRLDATRDTLPTCDWIVSSLFLHHLDDAAATDLLQRLADTVGSGFLIDDLERTRLNRGLVWLGAHLLSSSTIVHRDSDRSVRAAFTLPEIATLTQQAGLVPARLESRFPARLQLLWKR